MFSIPALPLLDYLFDLTTITLISCLITLSVVSLCFIFHLRFKSKYLVYLQGFNSLWTVRFLLVLFIFFWAIAELLRIPFFRRNYLHPVSPSQQTNLCKVHLVLSLGFFEPAFLVTLLFLLNASIKKKKKKTVPGETRAISFVLLTCLPIAAMQALLIFLNTLENRLPDFFHQTSVVLASDGAVLCSYPLSNSIVFAAFGVGYMIWFLSSCWRVLSLVINKGLRVRVYGLAFAVMVALPMQVVFLALTALWNPTVKAYGVVSLVVFLGAFCCAAAGEGILVIKPISDALDAGGICFRWIGGDGDRSSRSSEPERVEGRDGEGEGNV